jgi:hypothetical protein
VNASLLPHTLGVHTPWIASDTGPATCNTRQDEFDLADSPKVFVGPWSIINKSSPKLRNIMKALWLCAFLYLLKKVSQYIRWREIENVAEIKISDDIPGTSHISLFFLSCFWLLLSVFSLSCSSFILFLTSYELTKSSSAVQKSLLKSYYSPRWIRCSTFIELEGSLPYSQQPATVLHPQPD